jgi:oligoribonuclease (3'-5' exoribonuclease)
MRYVCIDIETTGLDPVNDQILQFAAVIRDTDKMSEPVEKSPRMVCYVEHDRYQGQPYALALNSDILSELSKPVYKRKMTTIKAENLSQEFWLFLAGNGYTQSENSKRVSFTGAGKNFGTFDLQFLKNQKDWAKYLLVDSRVLDPAMLFIRPTDKKLPGLKNCLQRIGIEKEISHDALEDVYDTIIVLETGLSNLWAANEIKESI